MPTSKYAYKLITRDLESSRQRHLCPSKLGIVENLERTGSPLNFNHLHIGGKYPRALNSLELCYNYKAPTLLSEYGSVKKQAWITSKVHITWLLDLPTHFHFPGTCTLAYQITIIKLNYGGNVYSQ